MADMIPKLREMAESPHYALRRGVLLVAAQHIEELGERLDSTNHDYKELLKERTDYVAENERLRTAIQSAVTAFRGTMKAPLSPGREEQLGVIISNLGNALKE